MNQFTGNIVLSVRHGVILHQVNCQGKMNSGVARDLRAAYPVLFAEYEKFCRGSVTPEDLLGCFLPVRVTNTLWVGNLFGQLNYGRDGSRYTSYDALDDSLSKCADWMATQDLYHYDVHHPLIGSGLGGGCWGVVAELIKHHIGPNTYLWTLPFQPPGA